MDISGYQVMPSKHFAVTWMRKWNYSIESIKKALEAAYRVEKVGKIKYEVYFRDKGESRKFILVKNEEYREIFIITGAEGR